MNTAVLRRTDVPGVGPVAFRDVGEGETVVLVHGNFASHRWWLPWLDAPPSGLRLLALDLPGFGASPPRAGPISIDRYADALVRFADALDLGAVVWVGHSLGGSVVQAAACAAPDRVRALLLIDSAAPGGLVTPEARYPALEALQGAPESMRAALGATLISADTPEPPVFFADLVDDALAMDPRAFTGNARALADMDLRDAIVDLAARFPVTVLHGAQDPIVDAAAAAATAAAWPGATLHTWSDAGHSPHLEHPRRFEALLRRAVEAAA